MLNSVQLIGRVGNDIELHNTNNGGSVTTVSLACSEKRKGSNGDYVDHTEWVRCVLFNKTAELASQYLSKGNLVYFGGKMQTSSYEKDGTTFYKTEVLVNNMKFLTSKSESGQSASNGGQSQAAYMAKAENLAAGNSAPGGSAFDDIPFMRFGEGIV